MSRKGPIELIDYLVGTTYVLRISVIDKIDARVRSDRRRPCIYPLTQIVYFHDDMTLSTYPPSQIQY